MLAALSALIFLWVPVAQGEARSPMRPELLGCGLAFHPGESPLPVFPELEEASVTVSGTWPRVALQVSLPESASVGAKFGSTRAAELHWLKEMADKAKLYPELQGIGFAFQREIRDGTPYLVYQLPTMDWLNITAMRLGSVLRWERAEGFLTSAQWRDYLVRLRLPLSHVGFTAHEYGQHALEYLTLPRSLIVAVLPAAAYRRAFLNRHFPDLSDDDLMRLRIPDPIYRLFEYGSAVRHNLIAQKLKPTSDTEKRNPADLDEWIELIESDLKELKEELAFDIVEALETRYRWTLRRFWRFPGGTARRAWDEWVRANGPPPTVDFDALKARTVELAQESLDNWQRLLALAREAP